MARYPDPENDFIFRRISGGHPDLQISFLNALMPSGAGRMIESVGYVPVVRIKLIWTPASPVMAFSLQNLYGRTAKQPPESKTTSKSGQNLLLCMIFIFSQMKDVPDI
jgi:hypothetical protein